MNLFGKIIKILREAKVGKNKIFGLSQTKLVDMIITAAGILPNKKNKSESYIKWYKTIPENISSYFQDGTVNEFKLTSFFKRYIGPHWDIVQHEFHEKINKQIFDCKNDDPEVFYSKLVEQLSDSLELLPPEKTIMQMIQKFEQIINKYNLTDVFKTKYSPYSLEGKKIDSLTDNDILDRIEVLIETLESDIIIAFDMYNEHYIFRNIQNIINELERYSNSLYNSRLNLFKGWTFPHENMNIALENICFLYFEIFGEDIITSPAIELPEGVHHEDTPIDICRNDREIENCIQCNEYPCKLVEEYADKLGGIFVFLTYHIDKSEYAAESQVHATFEKLISSLEEQNLTLNSVIKLIIKMKETCNISIMRNIFEERFNDLKLTREIVVAEFQKDDNSDLWIQVDVVASHKKNG
jgi:hypothetical protein